MVIGGRLHAASLVPLIVACVPAMAQAPVGGTVRGSVSDRDFGVPVAGVAVSIMGTRARVLTTEAGSFSIPNVAPGTYTLVFTKDGYVREVRPNVQVTEGQLTDVEASMAGEFEELEEVVAQDAAVEQQDLGPISVLTPPEIAPIVTLQPGDFMLRLESPQLLDVLGVETISRSGAGDAAAALLLVPGATLQEGKYAVVRGLPDRYVSVLLDSVRLPVSTPGKRAVQLDQFPASVIQSIQVSKSFTPDLQGEASGGGVNVVLRDIPDEPILQFRAQYGTNSQVKDGQFLTYPGGKLDFWGNNDVLQTYPELVGQSWSGNPTGTQFGNAPPIYKWNAAAGDSWEVDDDFKVGAFANFFYEAGASAYDNGQLNQWQQPGPGRPLEPLINGTPPPGGNFITGLYDVTQGTQSVQWGGLGTTGFQTEEHKFGAKFIYTKLSESQAVLLTDTRGKDYYFPDYNVDDPFGPGNAPPTNDEAPWQRLETLDYTQVTTQALILNGEHTLGFLGPAEGEPIPEPIGFGAPTIDWRVSFSKAIENQPDQTQFASIWGPPNGILFPPPIGPVITNPFPTWTINDRLVPFASAGWVQHINYYNEESSDQGALNIKLPFLQWNDREGYIKAGMFIDSLSREYRQSTFTNSLDPNTSYVGDWNDPWSAVFPSEDHPILASEQDTPYDGSQLIAAGYGMIDLPLNDTMNIVGGVRYETTNMSTTVSSLADPGALGVDPNDPAQTILFVSGNPLFDSSIDQVDWLPMIGFNWNILDDLVFRAAYARTLARPNFFEIVPVVQYEYVGGPIFIGNPQLQMSSLDNYDLRLDWTPHEGWLVSGSAFYKDIDQPIQYAQRFAVFGDYTSAFNYPSATLFGVEVEARITAEPLLGEEFRGLAAGFNFTWMDSNVKLLQQDIDDFAFYGINLTEVPMTATPDYLFNVNVTYDYEPLGTQLGLFYNYQGKSLVSAPNVGGTQLIPGIFQMPYGTLNFTLRQPLLWGFAFNFAAKNLTNPARETQYETPDGFSGLNSTYTAGIDLQFGLTFTLIF
ncbi:MAG: hypothetical protein RLZZ558_45 [Planctomycetota bacterium]|jgi:outer membrane receptor protein involved in Fe transport